ncbi:MAG: DUF1343 domain-containing protein [bacterium]|nr:DUF1343 domain-containing protein [bacterium]
MDRNLAKVLAESVRRSESPGAVACVGDVERVHFLDACGKRRLLPRPARATADTLYDVASLTKVVATTTAALLLHEDGQLDLDAPVSGYLPIPAFSRFAIRHLMTHTSGLVSGEPFYQDCSTVDEMIHRYAEEEQCWEPGTGWQYSDAGYMILGRVVELVARDSLDAFCRKRIFAPLKMSDTMFNPDALRKRCAATEDCAWRGRVMVGEVHDENAFAVGGVAGHAGLFSTASDLARFCQALLGGRVLKGATLDLALRIGQIPCRPWQGLGWELDPWSSRPSGYLPARTAFGHTGWTGTSMWMDRATGLFAILLSNTCHPSREDRDTETLRRVFYDGVAERYYPNQVNTHTGLDRLVRDRFDPLRGRKVALLTHHAALDQLGRHILDVLALDPEVDLRLVYSPEHGVRGQAEAGADVPSEEGDVPVISLYGDRTAPSREELSTVDCLVVDMQDVGARYYTYAATMKRCLAACAASGTPVLVLDRPNPIGGTIIEGPIADRDDSAVCWGRVPARHGMTMGEIALHFQSVEFGDALKLTVVPLDSWRPCLTFDQCSLPWTPPSPNIPRVDTAIVYAGTCLFEGVNLNEGRGTDTPFQLIGAPWLDSQAILDALPSEVCAGVALEAAAYTPRSIPGKASQPRYLDEACSGIRIALENAIDARPFALTVAMLSAIHERHAEELEWHASFDVLAGTDTLRTRIVEGEPPMSIVASFAPGLAAFDEDRPRLYGDPGERGSELGIA